MEFEVEKILGEKEENGKLFYFVKWKGYSDQESSWEPLENVQHLTLLLEEFKKTKDAPKEQIIEAPPKSKKVELEPIEVDPYEIKEISDREMERQFVLRLPKDLTLKMKECLKNNDLKDADVTFQNDRDAIFHFGGKNYKAKLVDLPCITEAYKSNDLTTYYKSGDVSQMLLVQDEAIKEEISNEYDSGLTPPMKNVRTHWKKQKLNVDKEEIKKMVDDFMKIMSEESDNVKIEIFSEEEEETYTQTQDVTSERSSSPVSFSEDISEEENSMSSPRSEDQSSNSDAEIDQWNQEREQIVNEITLLESQIYSKQKEVEKLPNPIMRKKFEDNIKELKIKLESKKERLTELNIKLGRF